MYILTIANICAKFSLGVFADITTFLRFTIYWTTSFHTCTFIVSRFSFTLAIHQFLCLPRGLSVIYYQSRSAMQVLSSLTSSHHMLESLGPLSSCNAAYDWYHNIVFCRIMLNFFVAAFFFLCYNKFVHTLPDSSISVLFYSHYSINNKTEKI